MLTGTLKFIININDQGDIEVLDGHGEPVADPNRGSLTGTDAELARAVDLSNAPKLLKFDSLAIMGYGSDRAVTMVCIKRANCTWYCG
jgi:hypothetical protein